MPYRIDRIVGSWSAWLRRLILFTRDRDPFNLKSGDALKDPEVREALRRWQAGEVTSEEFRRWLDEKWERDHS